MMIRNNIYKFLIGFLFLFLTWLMLFNYGHCASDQDYFPMQQDENELIPAGAITTLNNRLDTANYYVFVRINLYNSNYLSYYWVRIPKSANAMMFAEIHNDLIHFSLYNYGPDSSQYSNGRITLNRSDYSVASFDTYNQNAFTNFTNQVSSNYDTSKAYISNFLLQSNSTSNARIVLMYDDGITVPDGDTARDDMEKPDSTEYYPDWSTSPTFDSSSVESGLSSVFNSILWFGNNIKQTIEGLGEYITDTVRWSIQKVLDRITTTAQGILSGVQTKLNEVITTLGGKFEDLKSKFEDVKSKLDTITSKLSDFADLFIHPFDEEEYEEQIANCELINQYNKLIENCEAIQAIFDYAEERDHFSLYIDFENPFADAQHRIITSEISFDWLVPLRSVYRPFLWVFTLIELFVGSMRILGNVIGGKAK